MRVEYSAELNPASTYQVPWRNPETGAEYLDLRATPQAIERIEPARRHPPLRGFLAAVNSADSVFATLSCRAESDPADPQVFRGEVAVVFAAPGVELNTMQEGYQSLTAELVSLLMRDAGADTSTAHLVTHRCRFTERELPGFCLVVRIAARGESSGQAELRWGLALARVQQALLYASRVIRHHLPHAAE